MHQRAYSTRTLVFQSGGQQGLEGLDPAVAVEVLDAIRQYLQPQVVPKLSLHVVARNSCTAICGHPTLPLFHDVDIGSWFLLTSSRESSSEKQIAVNSCPIGIDCHHHPKALTNEQQSKTTTSSQSPQ